MTTTIVRLAAALALAVAGDAFAAAQMYKCVENGRTVYQQQACNPQPESAAASAAKPAASAASDASAAAGKKLRRPSPVSSAPATPR
jgi:sugar/nucleoside kinase (ribokinase family)